MLVISLVLSTIVLLIIFVTAYLNRQATGAAICAGGLLSVLSLCLMFFPVALAANAAVLVGVAAVWQLRGWNFRRLVLLSLAATLMVYAFIGFFAYRELTDMQSRYPYQSMEARLPAHPQSTATDPSPADLDGQLAVLETRIDAENGAGSMRGEMLKRLHEDVVGDFANASGFGVARMSGMHDYKLKWGLRHYDTPLPQPGARSTAAWSAGFTDIGATPEAPATSGRLLRFHMDALVEFVYPAGFGFFKDRRHVAGFQSHRLSQELEAVNEWQLRTLDLIGLVVHDEPVVYVSENLPRMDELREAPTRAPDAFEAAALAELRSGKDLLVREADGSLRALGAIRSARQCVDCHGGQRGDLLGAFSYSFGRSDAKLLPDERGKVSRPQK